VPIGLARRRSWQRSLGIGRDAEPLSWERLSETAHQAWRPRDIVSHGMEHTVERKGSRSSTQHLIIEEAVRHGFV
jgi:hypothetical protein